MGWYGLITDLDRRGMLDDTLVVCTSEHGRTPQDQQAPRAAGAITGRGSIRR